MDVATFEQRLSAIAIPDMVQEHLFEGIPYCFRDQPETFYTFRKEICEFFRIHPQNFTVVGSAKIGFSLNPKKYGRPFSDASDIDVVLISDELFGELWFSLIEFKKTVLFRLDPTKRERFETLQKVVFYGSLRLDMVSNDFAFAKTWWEFFNRLSVDKRFGPRRVRAMIFKSWRHVSFYYEDNLRVIKEMRGV